MTAPRDDQGDPITAADVTDPWDATDGDRRSLRPTTRTNTGRPKLAGGERPEWADERAAGT